MSLESLGDDINKNNFQWPTIVNRYKEREGLEDCNVYTYCAKHWSKSKDRPPQFFGFNDKPSWPLTEDYSKWILTLYKPWRQSSDELKHSNGTYKSTLETYMHDAQFPQRIKTAILRVKRNEKAVKLDESTFFQEAIGTPTSDCKNKILPTLLMQ